MLQSEVLKVFIGYDQAEPVAYHACCQSILDKCKKPVIFFPIGLSNCPEEFDRPRGEKDSTEFAITRFLVPYLCNFQGFSLFMDCDVVVREDLSSLFEGIDERFAVSVVKHNYVASTEKKFLGQEQTQYGRKNWSSVMLFNNSMCKALTPQYVQEAHGLSLHQFKWVEDDLIGELEPEWNYLVGEGGADVSAKIAHFTKGGPYFSGYEESEYSDDWYETLSSLLKPHFTPHGAEVIKKLG